VAFTDNTGVGGQTYYYVVSAFDASNVESVGSNQASTVISVVPLFVGLAGMRLAMQAAVLIRTSFSRV